MTSSHLRILVLELVLLTPYLQSAALLIVLLMIFPLSFTLTTFLMWIIVSLNGTILHLSQRKQRAKLAMFQRLWRILVLSVIAVAGFFVISTMSLSGRLEEDYAARNWRYRWILLDASLAGIYLLAFAAVAWIWRPVSLSILFFVHMLWSLLRSVCTEKRKRYAKQD